MSIVIVIVAALLVIATVLPMLPLAHGLIRVGDFPRQQILVVALVALAASFLAGADIAWWLAVQLALAAVAIVQSAAILPFTPLWRRQSASPAPGEEGEGLSLLACNVKMSNRSFDALAGLIGSRDPDIFILMEVDEKWLDALQPVLERYPHIVALPQDNSYGMAVASRFALTDTEAGCLLTDGVPSIITTVETPQGQKFRLYAIHPEPPVPQRGTEGRDGETSLVALRVREETLPVLVTGDLNDVAWSRTTTRFRRISGLLDPRIGRKVFSTFDARYPLVRWPLDHLFHSADFRIVDMMRLPPCGSDHFPVEFDLMLCPRPKAESRPEEANGEDLERARDLTGQARRRDEDPIGTDWED